MFRVRPLFIWAAFAATVGLAACANDAAGPTMGGPDEGTSTETGAPNTAGAGDTTAGAGDTTVSQLPGDTSVTQLPGDTTVSQTPAPALLVCSVRPYASKSVWIGPEGGEIKVGKNEFKVPGGALDQRILITMEVPSDSVRSVRFGPEGLTFNPGRWPELKLDYAGCPEPKDKKGKGDGHAKVVYVTEQLQILQVLPTSDDSLNGSAQTHLKHFSRYAITY